MSTAAIERDRSRRFSRRTLILGFVSPVLLVAGFGWVPFAWELGALSALAAIVYGVRTLRRPRRRRASVLAAIGIFFASLALFVFCWITITFALSPPE